MVYFQSIPYTMRGSWIGLTNPLKFDSPYNSHSPLVSTPTINVLNCIVIHDIGHKIFAVLVSWCCWTVNKCNCISPLLRIFWRIFVLIFCYWIWTMDSGNGQIMDVTNKRALKPASDREYKRMTGWRNGSFGWRQGSERAATPALQYPGW